MVKKLIPIIFLVLILITIVSAQPPFVQESGLFRGFEIKIPEEGTIKQNQDYSFHFHVFNISDGMPLGEEDNVDCYFHLYNQSGDHILEVDANKETTNVINEWDYLVLKGNFSTIGMYTYIIQCNSTDFGGYTSVGFHVTGTGTNLDEGKSIIYVGSFFILVFFFLITMFGISKLPSSNIADPEGRLLSISYLKYLRPILMVMLYFLIVAMMFLMSNIGFAYLEETLFADTFFMLYKLLFAMSPVVIIIWLISFFVMFFHDKRFQKMLNRGIFTQGKV